MGKKFLIIIIFFHGCSCDESSIRKDLNDTEKMWLSMAKKIEKPVNAYSSSGFTDAYSVNSLSEDYLATGTVEGERDCPERTFYVELKHFGFSSSLGRYSFVIEIYYVSDDYVKLRLFSSNNTQDNKFDDLGVSFNLRDSGNFKSFDYNSSKINQTNGLKFIGEEICRNKKFDDVYSFSIEDTLLYKSSIKNYYISKTYGIIKFVTKDSTIWELDYN